VIRLVCAWMLVNGLLLAPQWAAVGAGVAPRAAWICLEAALIAGAVALVPRSRWSRALAWMVALGVVATTAVAFADLVFRVSLGRPLDLSLDLYLIDAVRRLALGNVGTARTVLLFAVAATIAGLSVAGIGFLLDRVSPEDDAGDARRGRLLAAGLACATAVTATLGLVVPAFGGRVAAPAASLLAEQASRLGETRRERAAFAAQLDAPPSPGPPGVEPLGGLEGRHVVIAYIESYGMAALDDPEFGAVVRPRLTAVAERLDSSGIHAASGVLTSPTVGGQSWYAHGTMLSGLWLDDQLRYRLLLASDRETLVDDFRRAGHRTATVMPAITTAWPEALRIGYDDIYTAENIPYRGPPFYWVTMPDQFTWSFLGTLLEKADGPLFAEVGMVSSHAPWTPVLPLVEWGAMEGGAVFEPYRLEGYPPEEIWWDVAVLRENYARSLDYSLEAMAQFALRFLDDRTLLVVAGDHQAAPWVTGATSRDVPVHVLAREPSSIEPFLEWGFIPGTVPDPAGPSHRMDAFRPWLVQAFSDQ
jgi:hypothetical protein